MSCDRWARLARNKTISELDLQLPKMFRVPFRAAVFLQEPSARLMNLFDNRVFKLLRHRALPRAHAAGAICGRRDAVTLAML